MMKIEIILFLLVNLEFNFCLNCYSCSGSTGCNDPFNSLGSGVTTTGTNAANIYCYKQRYIDTYNRGGVSTCTNYYYSSNGYQTCCSTDFCNSTKKFLLNKFLFIFVLFNSI